MNVLYGASGFASVVEGEIDARREVVLTVRGWKRKIILRALALYAKHESSSSEEIGAREMYAGLAWRAILVPTFIALCAHARQAGMSIKAYDNADGLDVHFQPVKG